MALGGSLHQRLQDLPGRLDHSAAMLADERIRRGKAHAVSLVPGCWLHRLAGMDTIAVNSLHDQGVDVVARGLQVQAVAPDGTIEAFRHVSGRAVGVQWHPEYDYASDPVSRRLFEDFGDTVRGRRFAQAAE